MHVPRQFQFLLCLIKTPVSDAQILSFDALFGLCQKKHACVSGRPPLYGTTFLEEVDQYVRCYDSAVSSWKGCSYIDTFH